MFIFHICLSVMVVPFLEDCLLTRIRVELLRTAQPNLTLVLIEFRGPPLPLKPLLLGSSFLKVFIPLWVS